ncbi:hypothetical protein [Cellulosimicrobium sp. CUA-896]|uniref:hypothetical protein n=1 Tax=Cellulosimicrobium sp. CUA-896 TaxID=1517881 RepID=UPI00351670B2
MPGPGRTPPRGGVARFAGRAARGALECVDVLRAPERLLEDGPWFVVADFDAPATGGRVRAWRFAERTDPDEVVRGGPHDGRGGGWQGPAPSAWTSSLDRAAYESAVARVRAEVREGEVYQANVCRVLSAPLAPGGGREPDAEALARRLAHANPAPTGGCCTCRRAAASTRCGSSAPRPSSTSVSAAAC